MNFRKTSFFEVRTRNFRVDLEFAIGKKQRLVYLKECVGLLQWIGTFEIAVWKSPWCGHSWQRFALWACSSYTSILISNRRWFVRTYYFLLARYISSLSSGGRKMSTDQEAVTVLCAVGKVTVGLAMHCVLYAPMA